MHTETQKITVEVNKRNLQRARKYAGGNITETVNKALEKLALSDVYAQALKLRGTHKFSLDLNELRKDKDEE